MDNKLEQLKPVLLQRIPKPSLLFTMKQPENKREMKCIEILEQADTLETLAIGIGTDTDLPHYGFYYFNSEENSFEFIVICEANTEKGLSKSICFDKFLHYIDCEAFYIIGISRCSWDNGEFHMLDATL